MVRSVAKIAHIPLGRVVRYGLIFITGLGVLTACDPRRAQSDVTCTGYAAIGLFHPK